MFKDTKDGQTNYCKACEQIAEFGGCSEKHTCKPNLDYLMDKKILEVLSILEDEDNRAAAVGKFNVSDAYAHAYSIVHSLLSVK